MITNRHFNESIFQWIKVVKGELIYVIKVSLDQRARNIIIVNG